MFVCRADVWPGFNPHFRGFGGEELYIHNKARQADIPTLCQPSLGWVHRFGRPAGTPYPNTWYDRCRNYVLGLQELGLPLAALRAEFVPGKVSEETWEALVANPTAYTPPGGPPKTTTGAYTTQWQFPDLPSVVAWPEHKNSPHHAHYSTLTQVAAEAQTVVEFSDDPGTTANLLAGQPEAGHHLVSYIHKLHFIIDAARRRRGHRGFQPYVKGAPDYTGDPLTAEPRAVGALVVTSPVVGDGNRWRALLDRWAPHVAGPIVLLGGAPLGEAGLAGGPGLRVTTTAWADQAGWYCHNHNPLGIGCTVWRRVADRPEGHPYTRAWAPGYGVGTELKRLLARVGIVATATCSCNQRALEMDRLGPVWCRQHANEILDWLGEEAARRSQDPQQRLTVPYTRAGAWALLKLAQRLGEKACKREEGILQ
jgi:hypothetical protein